MDRDYYIKIAAMEENRWWNVARRRIFVKVLEHLKLDPEIDILEIGCGTGGNLKMLSKFGNIFAAEPDDTALDIANNLGIAKIEKGSLPDNIPFEDKQFDIITMFDVLEHVDNDVDSLKALRNRLKKNGKLLLTVPAYDFLWSRIDVDSHHKRRYLKSRLINLLYQVGFNTMFSSYFNTILFPLILAIRIINKFRDKQDSLDMKIPTNFINLSLTKIFSFESFLIPKISLPYGISIFVVASLDNPSLN